MQFKKILINPKDQESGNEGTKNKRDKWKTNTNVADSNPDAQVIILSVNRLKNNLNEENFRLNTKARLNYMLCRRDAPEIQRHKYFGI